MYVNKCIKCGREFETKNPKRVICPECLYPDKSMMLNSDSHSSTSTQSYSTEGSDNRPQEEAPRFYSAGGNDDQPRYSRPQRQYDNRNNRSNYGQRPQGNNRYPNNRGGYNQRPQQNNRYQNNRFNNQKRNTIKLTQPA